VQSVPASSVVATPRRAGRPWAAVLGVAALLALAGAGALALTAGHSARPAAPLRPAPATGVIGGVPLQQARCANWLGASAAERAGTARALAAVVGGRTPQGPATTLTSAEAQRLFDHACASPIARNFLLYELYIRAAGFHSFLPAP
jgi:hypothetical protein